MFVNAAEYMHRGGRGRQFNPIDVDSAHNGCNASAEPENPYAKQHRKRQGHDGKDDAEATHTGKDDAEPENHDQRTGKFAGAAVAPNGQVVFAPRNADVVFVLEIILH